MLHCRLQGSSFAYDLKCALPKQEPNGNGKRLYCLQSPFIAKGKHD